MNVIPVVFSFDSRIILGASVSIKSLIDCAKDDTVYDIRILHSDLSLKWQKALNLLVKNTRHKMAFHYINPKIFANAPHNNSSWTELVYYRLLIPEVLIGYDKAIYSDVDVLFKDDLSEVFNNNLDEYEIAAMPFELNDPETIRHTYFDENKNDKIYSSGFLVMNCKRMREEKTIDKFLKTIEKYRDKLRHFDLDVINITCNKVLPVDSRYCVFQSIFYSNNLEETKEYKYINKIFSPKEIIYAKENPVIIHYAGNPGKPWRMKTPYADYKEYIDKLPKVLRKYTFRDIRKRFFSKV